ncbi:hypothetical protein ACQEVZ_01050 [Dactylosporangium sp. CA-152071]|uniref:hypothetical protein n=1 Tax=Dactylosporangium sp. CA-152071 TaxID=3239933 RepID=UPI003D9069F3
MTLLARPVTASVRSVLPPARRLSPASVWALAGGYAAAWIIVGPSDGGWLSFAGQLAGAEAVLLMSVAIVLISVLPAVEAWFDCGPAGMVGAFVRRFREAGIPNRNIHREHFDWR